MSTKRLSKPSAVRLSKEQLEALVEEATIDANGESEQITGFRTMMENDLATPFSTEILGVEVTVERVDLTESEEIVAVCKGGKQRQLISILEVPLPSPPPKGAEWIEAYRWWRRRWG